MGILFAALVDLLQKGLEDLLLQTLALVHLRNLRLQVGHALLLPLLVEFRKLQLLVELLDLGFLLGILTAVVLLEHLALLRGDLLQGLVDDPGALVVLDVGANLAENLRVGEGIEVVVLRLEVLAHGNQDVQAGLEVLGRGCANVVQCESDREVEGVVGSLEDDNEGELVETEVVEVDMVFRGSEEIALLAELRLEGDLVEEFNHVDVALVLAEVLLQEHVDGRFQDEGIVDGNHANAGLQVPARLSTASLGGIHDVVGDEEEGLEKLDHPSQQSSLEVLLGRGVQGLVEQDGGGVDHRHAAVAFSTDGVVVQGLHV